MIRQANSCKEIFIAACRIFFIFFLVCVLNLFNFAQFNIEDISLYITVPPHFFYGFNVLPYLTDVLRAFKFAEFIVGYNHLAVAQHYPVGAPESDARMQYLYLIEHGVTAAVPICNIWK